MASIDLPQFLVSLSEPLQLSCLAIAEMNRPSAFHLPNQRCTLEDVLQLFLARHPAEIQPALRSY